MYVNIFQQLMTSITFFSLSSRCVTLQQVIVLNNRPKGLLAKAIPYLMFHYLKGRDISLSCDNYFLSSMLLYYKGDAIR